MSERNGRQMIEALKAERPNVAISVIRTEDHYTSWDGDGEIDRAVFQCYDHEVRATTVHNGELITASSYLGGSWYDLSDTSAQNLKNLSEISGYLPQMIDEALEELDEALRDAGK